MAIGYVILWTVALARTFKIMLVLVSSLRRFVLIIGTRTICPERYGIKMFKREINQQTWYALVPLVWSIIGLAILLFVLTDFSGRIPIIIVVVLVTCVFLMSFLDLVYSKPIVAKNTDESVEMIIEKHLQIHVNEVKKRFEKNNPGTNQQVQLANYCMVLLAYNARSLGQLENVLTKKFKAPVQLNYEAKYVFIPGLDEEDERAGSLELKIGDHESVIIKVW